MDEFYSRQINIMRKLCEELIARRADPVGFVSNQWTLINLVRSNNPLFWDEYQNVVNEIEIIVAISLDGKGSLEEDEWLKIENIGKKILNLLKEP